MARAKPSSKTPPWLEGAGTADGIHASMEAFQQLTNAWLDAQKLSLQMWSENQARWKAWQSELWDEWSVHFGGGAPIDV